MDHHVKILHNFLHRYLVSGVLPKSVNIIYKKKIDVQITILT